MPRKPTTSGNATPLLWLSHSQIELWEKCPFAWYLTNVLKVPRAPAEALILGNALHAALEADGRQRIADKEQLGMQELAEIADQAMDDELAKADPSGLLSEAKRFNMRHRVQAMIVAYLNHVAPRYRPLTVEEAFSFDVDTLVHFTGRIDAQTANAIIDWKTSGKLWQPGDVDGKDQATAYLIARPEMRQVTFIVFSCHESTPDTCIVQSHIARRTDAQKIAYQAKIRATADDIMRAKKNNRFPLKPGPLCGWCGVLGSCSSGQTWLQTHHREPAVPLVGEVVKDQHAGEGAAQS